MAAKTKDEAEQGLEALKEFCAAITDVIANDPAVQMDRIQRVQKANAQVQAAFADEEKK